MADSLYVLLQQAAHREPDLAAVRFRSQTLTYRQLLDASTRVAGQLAQQGAGPGRRVAFCFRKSVEALVALFGLIRTGATYVPLDPTWPRQRIETICDEAAITLWVGNVPPAASTIRTAVVSPPCTEGIPLSSAAAPMTGDPLSPAGGVANILFTSGSTGRPKGIEITTQSLMHFSQWVVAEFGLTSADRIANHAPYHFDLSTLDIFAAVRAGAAMVPVPEAIKGLPYQMVKLIADEGITVWYSVPFALTTMLDKLAAHDLGGLRHVVFAGEVMPKPTLHALARALPHVVLTNLYGPTETNVCTWHRVTPDDLATDEPLPIGVPISDTRTWIVAEEGGLTDAGPGELWVAGPTLTSGYFGDAELTGRRLVPAPDGKGLAYRTGDLVSRRPDGVLRFHGRCDRMIKVRGYRIEPGEIEAVLGRHPAVEEAVVFLAGDATSGERLVACLATDPAARPSELELLEYCRQTLPAGMIPEALRFLDELPRTDRGKIDLQALRRS